MTFHVNHQLGWWLTWNVKTLFSEKKKKVKLFSTAVVIVTLRVKRRSLCTCNKILSLKSSPLPLRRDFCTREKFFSSRVLSTVFHFVQSKGAALSWKISLTRLCLASHKRDISKHYRPRPDGGLTLWRMGTSEDCASIFQREKTFADRNVVPWLLKKRNVLPLSLKSSPQCKGR